MGKAGGSAGIRLRNQSPKAATPSTGGDIEGERERLDEAEERDPETQRDQEPTRRETANVIVIPIWRPNPAGGLLAPDY